MNEYPREEKLPVFKNYMKYSCNNTDKPSVMAHLHWHDVYEVLYIRSGWGRQKINTEEYLFYPGDVIVLLPGDLHATEAVCENGCEIDYVQFSGEFLYDEMYVRNELCSGVIHSENKELEQIFDALNQYTEVSGCDKKIIMAGLTQLLAGFILGACRNNKTPVPTAVINKLIGYMENAEDLRLETMAEYIGYSPEHLSRKFRRETGISYRSCCNRIRMRRAVEMLNDENNSIACIAERLGYSDESSFIRAFRRMYGMTPNLCRNRLSSPLME